MSVIVKLRSLKQEKMVQNVHFWIVIAIVLAIAVIYYDWYAQYEWFWYFSVFEFKNDIIGSLFLIPFLYASLVLSWRGSLVVWSLSMAAILPRILYYSFELEDLLRNVVFSLIPLMVVAFISLELTWRETQRTTLAEREKERQIYMSQMFKAQEDERRHIAQELHDDTIQELLVIANRAQKLVSGKIPITPEAKEYGKSIRDAVLQVSKEIRRLSRDLRPSILDNVGLVPAIRWLTDRLNEEEMIDSRVVVKGSERGFGSEAEVSIFRIVQESLNNVRRHSGATQVLVTIEFSPESAKIVIQDNGKGFILDKTVGELAAEGKLGIIGMQQRAKFLNGTVGIHSQLGEGTEVSITIVGDPDV